MGEKDKGNMETHFDNRMKGAIEGGEQWLKDQKNKDHQVSMDEASVMSDDNLDRVPGSKEFEG